MQVLHCITLSLQQPPSYCHFIFVKAKRRRVRKEWMRFHISDSCAGTKELSINAFATALRGGRGRGWAGQHISCPRLNHNKNGTCYCYTSWMSEICIQSLKTKHSDRRSYSCANAQELVSLSAQRCLPLNSKHDV